jgi:hypothetical protein
MYGFVSIRKKISIFLIILLALLLIFSIGVNVYLGNHWNPPELMTPITDFSGVGNTERTPEKEQKILQNHVHKIDATHLVRKYHNRLSLLNIGRLLQDQIVIDLQNRIPDPDSVASQNSFYIQSSQFPWKRRDNMRQLDVIRMTFRGNGIPKDAAKLATSELLEPKLKAFYQALSTPNVTLWHNEESLQFSVSQYDGKIYTATSSPFISIQPISKDDYARMKAATLPFLWTAYSDEEHTEKDKRETTISGNLLDSEAIRSLFIQQLTPSSDQAKAKEGIMEIAANYLNRLSQYDPEFSSLFLMNSLFEQYNLVSLFKKNVELRINAIETKLNVTYIGYNIRFHLSEKTGAPNSDYEPISKNCKSDKIDISDEYFLIPAESEAYIMRIYLPDCLMTSADYETVDQFVNHFHILNNEQLRLWRNSIRN